MNRESELKYVDGHSATDSPFRWNTEAGYLHGMGEDGDSSSWVDAFKEVLPAVATIYQQREFNKMNQALINTGKPPISADQYMATSPAAKVQVGVDSNAQKMLMYAGIGVLALVGLRAAKLI